MERQRKISKTIILKDLRKGLWDIHEVARDKIKQSSDIQNNNTSQKSIFVDTVSLTLCFDLKRIENKRDGNKQTEEQNKKTPTRKVSSVVKKVEKKKKSTDNEKTKLPSAECSPLREPSPMTVEFEELMATKLTTPTEDLSFTLPVIAVTDIEQSLDSTPLMSVQGVNEPVKEDDNKEKPVQVNKKPDEIQEPEEQPKENTFTEVREELVEVSEDGVKVMNEDIGLVEINCMTRTPTPSYLPSRITPTNLKYGRVYDYRHYDLPEDKDKEDPRQVLLCPPSTYHSSKEAILLRRLREQARRSHIDTTTLPDGYSGLVKQRGANFPMVLCTL
ncbi:Hypothetical predicted protein [Mytilus galloprovincialis]|uniref:Uncharacterized protein n=1 Tax=Mytilus galloprovincialis TaxID=29158 RepID=A0A8B6F674_MYTGA|nr:Hypothetical predicted protein [Mytilus galloprovincialis]